MANGLARAAKSESDPLGPMGVMPLGSANDLVYSLGLPTDLKAAAGVIAAGRTKAMDLGRLNDKYFANNSACGLEPYVTTKHERIHWIKGVLRYLVAAVQAIMDKPEWHGRVEWDDGIYEGPLSLVSVGNGRRTGGFFMTPHADPFDGKLTLAFGYRATRMGMFLAFQYPVAIPGVSVANFLRTAINARRKSVNSSDKGISVPEFRKVLKERMDLLKMDYAFAGRYLNDGFSGGEKKRAEILQMAVLRPEIAILDETDSGLDIDALRIVSEGVNALRGPELGVLVITHYQRILNYIKPDRVHIMLGGRIVESGGSDLALHLEEHGYDWVREKYETEAA